MREYYNEIEAADFIGRKPGTLNAWRYLKKGPVWFKDPEGKPQYRHQDLVTWIEGGSQEAENRMEK